MSCVEYLCIFELHTQLKMENNNTCYVWLLILLVVRLCVRFVKYGMLSLICDNAHVFKLCVNGTWDVKACWFVNCFVGYDLCILAMIICIAHVW